MLKYLWIQLTGCQHKETELKSSLGRVDIYECCRCKTLFYEQKEQ